MKVVFIIVVLSALVAIVTVGYTMHKVTFTPEQRTEIFDACQKCHRNPERLEDDEGSIHDIHASADCTNCHVGARGLAGARHAHDTTKWIGIGVACATVAGLGVNYVIARKRLGKREGDG